MKKITILSLHLGVGGIERYISSITKLLQNDYEIELIITYKLNEKPSFLFDNKIKITYLIDGRPNKSKIIRAIKRKKIFNLVKELLYASKILFLKKTRTKKAIKELETDILITTRTYETALANKYIKNPNIRKIATEHNYPTKRYKNKLLKSITNYDKLVVVNKEIENIYKKEIGDKVISISNFIDSLSDERSELKNKNIISVGRFSKEKGFIDLIETMALVVKKDKDITLTLIGDGKEREAIINKIKELNLESNVKLTGYLNEREVACEMLNSSLYVMTSITESFGLVLLEAMNYGLPIISFSSSGPRDLLSDNTGLLIENRNKLVLSETIVNLLNSKKDLKFYSERSLIKVKDYTPSRVKSEWLKLIEEVSKKSSKKVLFVSSAGGHYNELLMLNKMFEKYNYKIITEKTASTKNIKTKYGKRNAKFLLYSTRRNFLTFPFKLIINTFKSLHYYLKFKPEYIVTTGAGTAGPICLIGKIFGTKIIYIETFANIKTKTLTGKIIYKFADLFIVQWESMLKIYENATYGGWIY